MSKPAAIRTISGTRPDAERVLWHGKPTYRGMLLRAFHARAVAIYFVLLMAWRLGSGLHEGRSLAEASGSALWLVPPAVIALAILAGLAWLYRRSSSYTLTTSNLVLQFGAALPVTMTIPLGLVTNAAVKMHRDGSGDIPLAVAPEQRVSWALLWPHIRPWRLRLPEPMLISVPEADRVAALLGEALKARQHEKPPAQAPVPVRGHEPGPGWPAPAAA